MAKTKTTKVRILVPVAGADFSWYPGQVVEMRETEAAKWADGERGEYVTPPAQPVDEQPNQTEAGTEPASDGQPAAGEPDGTGGDAGDEQPASDEQTTEAEVRTEQPEPTGENRPVRGGQTVETTESTKRPARGGRGGARGKAGSVETT